LTVKKRKSETQIGMGAGYEQGTILSHLTKIIKTFVNNLFNLFKSPSKFEFNLTYLTILNPQTNIIKYGIISNNASGNCDRAYDVYIIYILS